MYHKRYERHTAVFNAEKFQCCKISMLFSNAFNFQFQSCQDIEQFVKQPLYLSYSNQMQSLERAVKMTTTASGQIAGSKRQIGEALCTIAEKESNGSGKKYYFISKAAHASQ